MSCPDRRILSFALRRAELLQARAARPAEPPPQLRSPFVYAAACGPDGPVRVLDARRLAHRRRMLDYLQSRVPRRASNP